MRKFFLSFFFLILSTQADCTPSKVLHVYTWFDFLPRHIADRFEKETGIKVVIDHYDSNQTLEANLLTKTSGYDLVFPTAWPYFFRQVRKGLYQPLDKSKIPNWKNLDTDILGKLAKADPGNQHAVPYFWGLTGIGYNKKTVKAIMPDAPVDSWALLFDPQIVSKFEKCGVFLLDDATDVFSAALVYLGHPPHSRDPDHLKQAYDTIRKIRPYIRRFDSYRAMSDLANGEACIAQNWSGDIAISRARAWEAKRGVDVGFAIPKEGTAFWMDVIAIPLDAPNANHAHLFINFILDPEVMAEITNEMFYANGNSASLPFVREDLKNDPAIYPPKQYVEKAYVDEAYDPDFQREMNRMLMKLIMGRK